MVSAVAAVDVCGSGRDWNLWYSDDDRLRTELYTIMFGFQA